MTRLGLPPLIFIGMTIGGLFGWCAGDSLGLGLLTTLLVNTLGSIVGMYVGWRIMKDYLG